MNSLERRLRALMVRVAKLEQVAPSEESSFFDNPTKKNVRELAESKALSNKPEVVEKAVQTTCMTKDEDLAKGEAIVAPPPPEEIVEKPGGEELSTLNQFVVESKEPIKGVPQSYEETPRAEAPLKNPSDREVKEDLVKKVVERHLEKSEKANAVKKVLKERTK